MSMAQVLRLKPAFSDEQAEALAALFDEELATKRDTAALGADVQRLEAKLTSEIEKLRLDVQRDIKAAEARLIAWVVGQGAAVVAILFGLLHFVDK